MQHRDGPIHRQRLTHAVRPGGYEASYEHYGLVAAAFPRDAAAHYLAHGSGEAALPPKQPNLF